MDNLLKQRLVGAIVLVSLGVIFIPALLDGSGYKSRHARSIEIPEAPKFAPLTQLEIEKIKTPIELRKEQPKKQAKQTETAKKTTKKVPKKKPAEPIQSWALQIGTFGQKANALVLQDKLRAEKHPAYVSEIKVDGKQKFKVRIGPIIDKQRVEKLKLAIQKEHNLDGYVVRHP